MSNIQGIIEDLDYLKSEYETLLFLWKDMDSITQATSHNESICASFYTLGRVFLNELTKLSIEGIESVDITNNVFQVYSVKNVPDCNAEMLHVILNQLVQDRDTLIHLLTELQFYRDTSSAEQNSEAKPFTFNDLEVLQWIIEEERREIIELSRALYDREKDKMSMRMINKGAR